MNNAPLLVEIGTEELPPTALKTLSDAFVKNLLGELKDAGFEHGTVTPFATPRRLGVLIDNLPAKQADQHIERFGPAVAAAFDADGNPSKAAEGFARSCHVDVKNLETKNDGKADKLFYAFTETGKPLADILCGFIESALAKLPIPKRMRWGNHDYQFIRPMQWLVVMHGDAVLPMTIMGHDASNLTRGHRFHTDAPITITSASDYEAQLEKGFVVASFNARREQIEKKVSASASAVNGTAVMPNHLLDEVTALVEWPVPITGNFEARFLNVPKEALIATMQDNQKYFAVLDSAGNLLPHFITVSNIESKDPAQVIEGNERVIRPRFADAEFFFEQDLKQPLENNNARLKKIVFQEDLGTVFDKVERVKKLSDYLANTLGFNSADAQRAATLSKADLVSEMVNEFSSMQGIAGKYYAEKNQEAGDVAVAIEEQYKPKFASDTLPQTQTGQVLSLADKLDTLLGIWSAGLKPTGSKDPFALRRSALGVLRILIECTLPLNLDEAFNKVADIYGSSTHQKSVDAKSNVNDVRDFCMERMRAYCIDQGYTPQQFESVFVMNTYSPLDFMRRLDAVKRFSELPEADSLASANKRIANILNKSGEAHASAQVDESLFSEAQERTLFEAIQSNTAKVKHALSEQNYSEAMHLLASLKTPVDDFFDGVMVMAEDEAVKQNRMALLKKLRELFLGVADLSELQV